MATSCQGCAVLSVGEVSLPFLHLTSPTLPLWNQKSGLNDWGKHRAQSFSVHINHLENADSGSVGRGWGPRISISNYLSSDAQTLSRDHTLSSRIWGGALAVD